VTVAEGFPQPVVARTCPVAGTGDEVPCRVVAQRLASPGASSCTCESAPCTWSPAPTALSRTCCAPAALPLTQMPPFTPLLPARSSAPITLRARGLDSAFSRFRSGPACFGSFLPLSSWPQLDCAPRCAASFSARPVCLTACPVPRATPRTAPRARWPRLLIPSRTPAPRLAAASAPGPSCPRASAAQGGRVGHVLPQPAPEAEARVYPPWPAH